MVSRLLKGAFHDRPPQPRHSAPWGVLVVTNHNRVLVKQPEPGFRRPDTEACEVSGADKAIQIDRSDKLGHPFQILSLKELPFSHKAGKAISSDKACSGRRRLLS